MYNILTVASKSYVPFLDIFLNSFFKNGNTKDLNKLYIVDINLGDYKNYLYRSDKIVYLNTNQQDFYSGVHSEGWYQNTSQKIRNLYELLSSDVITDPIILIDSDVLVLDDISSLIDTDFDIQFTTMSDGSHVGASGVLIHQIGCFVSCNNKENSSKFIEAWVKACEILKQLNLPKPHETPAMNIVIKMINNYSLSETEYRIVNLMGPYENLKNIKTGFISDKISCGDKSVYPETKTLHFKTRGGSSNNPLQDFKIRTNDIYYHDNSLSSFNANLYLNKNLLNDWIKNENL
jgi:hypothetical protein